MKKKINIVISWLLVISVLIIIFYFSSQNTKKSESVSNNIIDNTIGGVNNGEVLDKLETKYSKDTLTIFFRNLAHLIEYAALGFFMFNALFQSFKTKKRYIFLISLASIIVIGSIDEIVQGFSDRNSNLVDVGIDTTGGFIGIVGMVCFYYTILFIRNKFFKKAAN